MSTLNPYMRRIAAASGTSAAQRTVRRGVTNYLHMTFAAVIAAISAHLDPSVPVAAA